MSLYSPSIEKLIESFEKLPSIGHKTAARLAFYILNCSEEETNEFIKSIQDAEREAEIKINSAYLTIAGKYVTIVNALIYQTQIHAQYVQVLRETNLQYVW